MTYDDDLDLARRLRRISEEPEPDVPGSLYRHLDEVAEGTTMGQKATRRTIATVLSPQGRRSGRSQVMALMGIAAALVIAVAAGTLLVAVRGTGNGAPSDRWTGLEWHDITSTADGLFADEPPNGGTYSFDAVVAWPGGLVATGVPDGLWTSKDGLTWKRVPGAPSLASLVAMGGRLVGFDGTQGWTSSDGVTWQSFSVPFAGTMFGTSVATSTGAVMPTITMPMTTDPGPGPDLTQSGTIAPYDMSLTVLYATADGISWSRATVPDDLAQAKVVEVSALKNGFIASGVVPDPNGSLLDGTVRASERYWSSRDGFTWSRVEITAPGGGFSLALPIYVGRLGYESLSGLHSEDGLVWTRDERGWPSVLDPSETVADGQRILNQTGPDPIFTVGPGDGHWQTLDQGGDVGSLPGGGRAYLLPNGVLYASGGHLYHGQAISGTKVAGTLHPAATITMPPASPGSPRPTVSQPPATPWSGISEIRKLENGPSGATSVTRWKGGYVAIRDSSTSDGVFTAWASPDGLTWTKIPDGTFGSLPTAEAAQDGDQVVIATWGGTVAVWASSDGLHWQQAAISGPPIGGRPMAGNSWGVVALMDDPQNTIFSDLGNSAIPGTGIHSLHSIAVSGYRWVVVGQADGTSPTPTGPAAWWSDDGVSWTAATVDDAPGDGLVSVVAGRNGFVAIGSAAGSTAGSTSLWTSSDGKSWHLGTAMGPFPGSASFTGDGTHILGRGLGSSGKLEFWTSLDGQAWTQLALSGDTATLLSSGSVRAYLLDTGVLFATPDGTWYGGAVAQR